MASKVDLVDVKWDDGTFTVLPKDQLQELMDNVPDLPGSSKSKQVIATKKDILALWPRRKIASKGTVRWISKDKKFLDRMRKKEDEATKKAEAEAKAQAEAQAEGGSGKTSKAKSNSKSSPVDPEKKLVTALKKDVIKLQMVADKNVGVVARNVEERPEEKNGSETDEVCSCPNCPFQQYKKALHAMSIAMEVVEQAKSHLSLSRNALVSIQETTITPPPDNRKGQTSSEHFKFPDVWQWQIPDGKTPLMIPVIDGKGNRQLKNTGIYLDQTKLDLIISMNSNKPNKMLTAIFREMYGEALKDMSYKKIPEKIRAAVYAYVDEKKSPGTEIKNYRRILDNLTYDKEKRQVKESKGKPKRKAEDGSAKETLDTSAKKAKTDPAVTITPLVLEKENAEHNRLNLYVDDCGLDEESCKEIFYGTNYTSLQDLQTDKSENISSMIDLDNIPIITVPHTVCETPSSTTGADPLTLCAPTGESTARGLKEKMILQQAIAECQSKKMTMTPLSQLLLPQALTEPQRLRTTPMSSGSPFAGTSSQMLLQQVQNLQNLLQNIGQVV